MKPGDLLMYGLLAVMVVLMFRSSSKRKKQAAELQQQLVPGAKVILHSGIVGKVLSIEENNIVIESAGSRLEVVRQAVRSISVWETTEQETTDEPAEAATEAPSEAVGATAAPKTPRKRAAKPAAEKTEN